MSGDDPSAPIRPTTTRQNEGVGEMKVEDEVRCMTVTMATESSHDLCVTVLC